MSGNGLRVAGGVAKKTQKKGMAGGSGLCRSDCYLRSVSLVSMICDLLEWIDKD